MVSKYPADIFMLCLMASAFHICTLHQTYSEEVLRDRITRPFFDLVQITQFHKFIASVLGGKTEELTRSSDRKTFAKELILQL